MGEGPADRLRAKRLRATPQRRAILDVFEGRDDEHLSAEEIHARAAARVPGIGRGTVYATLAELSELGLLASYGSQEPVRYETNVAPHDHFRCRLCLRIFDITLQPPSTAGLARHGHLVEDVRIVVDGVCRACQAYTKGLHEGSQAVIDGRQISDDALSTLSCVRHDSAVGPLLIGATADGIARLVFADQADFGPFTARAKTRRGSKGGRQRVDHLIASVDRFLAGDHGQADDVVDWALIGGDGRDLLESTRTIAWGERRSYHQLGVEIDPYRAGYLLGSNPMAFVFPCHRVTCGGEITTAYVGGLQVRDALEKLEHANL